MSASEKQSVSSRSGFLKRLGLGGAAVVAGVVARGLDPDGEPVSEAAPLIVMNAPGQTLSDFRIDTSQPRGAAIEIRAGGGTVKNGLVVSE